MRIILVVAVALAARLGSVWGFEVPDSASREFQSALRDLQAGHYAEALKTLTELDRRVPDNAEILHLSAILLDLTGRPEQANSFFERAAKSDPLSPVIRTNFGVSLMRLGKPERAEAEFRQALKLDPSTATAAFNLGTLLLARQSLAEAEGWLAKAFQLRPDVYENGYQLAFCSFLLEKHPDVERILSAMGSQGAQHAEFDLLKALNDQALGRPAQLPQVLERLLPLVAGAPELARQVTTLLFSQGLYRESIPLLRQLTHDEPGAAANWLRLGRAALAIDDGAQALKAGESALRLEPNAQAHVLLGDASEALGKPLEAVEHYQRAANLEPSEDHLYALGYEFLSHWNWEAASEVFRRGLQLHPNSWRMLIGSGAAQLAREDHENATKTFIAAIDADPGQALGYRLLAQTFSHADASFDAAVERFSQLYRKRPDDPWAVYFWTLALFERASRPGAAGWGDLENALPQLEKAAAAHPETFEFQYLLGEAFFLMQRWDGAELALRKAVLADPGDAQARYKLGLTLRRLGRAEEARDQLKKYQDLKSQQDLAVSKRMSETTKFIVDLKAP